MPRVQLKWPNDLWLDDRKLAGILIETASFGAGPEARRYAVVGVGINIARRGRGGPVHAAGLAAGTAAGDRPPARRCGRIAAPLVRAVQAFETFGFAPFQARFNARDALRDRAVVLSATAPPGRPTARPSAAPCWCILPPA